MCISSDVLAALSLVAVFGKGASVFCLKLLGLLLILQRGDGSAEGRRGAEPWQEAPGTGMGLGMGSLFLRQTFRIPLTWGMALGTGRPPPRP